MNAHRHSRGNNALYVLLPEVSNSCLRAAAEAFGVHSARQATDAASPVGALLEPCARLKMRPF